MLGDKGASVHVREFAHAAAGLGNEVLLVCARLGAGNPPPPVQVVELAPEEAPETRVAPPQRLGAGQSFSLLDRELACLAYDERIGERVLAELARRQFEPDFIYERHALFSGAGVHVAAGLAKPRILEVNAPLVEEHKRYRGLYLEHVARRMESESFRGSERIVAVSSAIRDHVCRAADVGVDRVHVIPNGVDLQRMRTAAGRDEIRGRLDCGQTECVISFIGSFKPWHGSGLLLDAFARVAPLRPRARLLAVGDGPARANFCARVAAEGWSGRVSAVGRVAHAQIPAWLAASDILVAPYLASADFYFSPLKVLEALAAGKPVIAPRMGQLTELIRDGQTGLLYPPGDAQACGEAILTLIDDPPRRIAMGLSAQASVAERGWDGVVRRVLAMAASIPSRQAA